MRAFFFQNTRQTTRALALALDDSRETPPLDAISVGERRARYARAALRESGARTETTFSAKSVGLRR